MICGYTPLCHLAGVRKVGEEHLFDPARKSLIDDHAGNFKVEPE